AAMIENAARLDAVMLRPIADADALTEMLSDPRITALCLGPGLGLERARALVPAALALPAQEKAASSVPGRRALHRAVHRAVHRGAHRAVQRDVHRAVLLDADALSAFADDPAVLFAALHPACVLTPHMGEFARLFPDLAARLDAPASTGPAHSPARSPARSPISSPAFSKVDAVREAAVRAGCTVLLKGPDTVIAGPDGTARISPALTSPTLTSPALTSTALQARAAPWLATAGSGDVLAGFITGLLARGFAPLAAAEIGAWLHVDCALAFGPGLIAEDLPDQLPAVFRNLGI
ncbi:MAG: ADP/ATP-dependent (S)-NAD(P)H-hydrate dehydratase, partial [Pseudomonadota bacterium]